MKYIKHLRVLVQLIPLKTNEINKYETRTKTATKEERTNTKPVTLSVLNLLSQLLTKLAVISTEVISLKPKLIPVIFRHRRCLLSIGPEESTSAALFRDSRS